MKAILLAWLCALVLGAEALIARQNTCCFRLSASGSVSGPVGQTPEGESRIRGGFPQNSYCLDGGVLADDSGRRCLLDPFVGDFTCSLGSREGSPFSVACDGVVSWDENDQVWACPTAERGSYVISPQQIGSSCSLTSLIADGCRPACSPSSAPKPPPSSKSALPRKQCRASLDGPFEFPHLIVPIDSASPDRALGTSFNGRISSTLSTTFNFDIPPGDAGKTCSLVFLFPNVPGGPGISGTGRISFGRLTSPVDAATTYENAPDVQDDYGTRTVAPGNAYSIASFDCPAGQRIGLKLASPDDARLEYFQNFNQPPIGLYITKC